MEEPLDRVADEELVVIAGRGLRQIEQALSDGSNALRLDSLAALLRRLRALDAVVKGPEFLHD